MVISTLKNNCRKICASSMFIALVLLYILPPPRAQAADDSLVSLPSFVYPLITTHKTSKFGLRKHPIRKYKQHHNGVDLSAPEGTPIRAVLDGIVVYSSRYKGYGNLVTIMHRGGFTTLYGHCQRIVVQTGQKVHAGQIIAYSGSTGLATGPHLHFEIRYNGRPVDPELLIKDLTDRAEG